MRKRFGSILISFPILGSHIALLFRTILRLSQTLRLKTQSMRFYAFPEANS